MEVVEKRKRLEEGEGEGKKMKGSKSIEAEQKKTVHDVDDDGEVEEFFAILRRIHVAVKYFEKGHGGSGDGRQTMARLLNPNFEREDFEGIKRIKLDKGSDETVVDNAVLDLNVHPNME